MSFANPEWLFLMLLVPILAVAAVLAGRFGSKPWEVFAAERLKKRLIKAENPLPRWISLGMIYAAIIGLALVLARPQGDAGTKSEVTMGRNIIIALDLSRSMRVQDVKPDRLSQAKIMIYEILESLQNDRVGLIAFAGSPIISAPLTIDHSAVKETVEQIDENWLPTGGSNLASAVKLATQVLRETGQKNNALILISDGEENSGEIKSILKEAETAGVIILSIGVGTEDGGFIPHPNFPQGMVNREGNRILSRLKPDLLKTLADETGGQYIMSGQGINIPTIIQSTIAELDAFRVKSGQKRIVIEFFQWVLFPVILFIMAAIVAGSRWRGLVKTSLLILPLLWISPDSQAGTTEDAQKAFSAKDFGLAKDRFRALAEDELGSKKEKQYRLGEGLSAYEDRDFRSARKAFSGAVTSEDSRIAQEAHLGMGNTLFQLGWMGLSGTAYPSGNITPDLTQFDELVYQFLEDMKSSKSPGLTETDGLVRFEALILNWTDAIRHYRSALTKTVKQGADNNEELTLTYLKRLQELLKEEEERTANQIQMMENALPMKGKQPGKDGPEGEEQEGDGSGGEGEKGTGKKGDQSSEENGESESDNTEEEEASPINPNESEEERASRLLNENSDLQKSAPNQGRSELSDPYNDW